MLVWRQLDKYAMGTDCERYTICRANIGEQVAYTAWSVRNRKNPEPLGTRVVAMHDKEARGLAVQALKDGCENHHELA
jgi:hypothetical protein